MTSNTRHYTHTLHTCMIPSHTPHILHIKTHMHAQPNTHIATVGIKSEMQRNSLRYRKSRKIDMVKSNKEGTANRGPWGGRTETLHRQARQRGAWVNGGRAAGVA